MSRGKQADASIRRCSVAIAAGGRAGPAARSPTRSRASSRRASSSSASRPTTSRSATPIRRARSSGLEVDLANDVAKRLGVQVELVPVIAANRMEFLKQGRIDLMIATMAYKPDRAEVIGIPEPFYYAGAANVFAKKNSGLKTWADSRASRSAHPGRVLQPPHRRGVRRAARRVQGRDRGDGGARGRQLRRHRVRHDVLRRHHGRRQVGRLRDGAAVDRPGAVGRGRAQGRPEVRRVHERRHEGLAQDGLPARREKKWGIPQSPYLVEQQAKYK